MARDERLGLGDKLALAAIEKSRGKDKELATDPELKHLPKGDFHCGCLHATPDCQLNKRQDCLRKKWARLPHQIHSPCLHKQSRKSLAWGSTPKSAS